MTPDRVGGAPERRRKSSDATRAVLFAGLILNEAAHRAVAGSMTEADWTEVSPGHGLIWRVVTKYFEDHKALPSLPQGLAKAIKRKIAP